MSIRIKADSTPEELKRALDTLRADSQKPGKKNLLRHFGKLKRGLDGLEHQNALRSEWD
jgi:hypothetical protein